VEESKIDLLNKHLKSKLFGIDKVIDEICDKIKAWYYVPESMIRPLIINLWGATGTGKTTLARDVAEFLAKDLIQIDLGEYVGDTTKNLGHNFFEKYYCSSKKPVIILIDEFHIARTKSGVGAEIDRKGMRSLWHLLSDGMLYIDESRMSETLDCATYLIEDAIENYKYSIKYVAENKNGEKRISVPANAQSGSPAEKTDELEFHKKRLAQPYKIFPRHLMSMISRAVGYDTPKELIKQLNENFVVACSSVMEKLENSSIQPKLDFTKALIFISGNLDELYSGSDNFDPDIDLEILEKRAEEITISDVKKELTNRFRLEQIGRLGNNHIIYPVLSKDSYYKIINKDLDRLKQFYSEKQGVNLNFQDSVIEVVYKEGVFPNQGARSVLSTVGTLVEASLANFYLSYKQLNGKEKDVQVSFESKEFIFKFGSETVKIPSILKIDELRKPVINQRSVISAIHESGHIVASILCLGVVPNRASVFVATSENSGLVELLIVESKKTIETFITCKKYITVILAGSVAEKLIYGKKEASCGASSDISKATRKALNLIADYGYEDMVSKTRSGEHFSSAIFRQEKHEKSAKKIIKECEKEARSVIKNNIPLLKNLADCMLGQTTVNKNDILSIMGKSKIKCFENKDYVKIYKEI
jgi:Peptidase family M41/ATPase family associated with various cellular activities (AAA)/C-terminal, D2-small domain, of ClpB protein